MKTLEDLDTHGYYNKTIHKCVLKLHLPLEIINKIYENLHNKNEVSGVFYCDDNDKVTHVDKNEGDEGSVYTPNNIINYHTHPINAYRNGKTCYGCPSGEDYRETIKFALAGNKAHLVFTVEGLYTIQVSPCKIRKMKELLDDTERGILIFLIEEYFKSIHDFRCVSELEDLKINNINITPYSFVDFANTFDIPNLLTNKRGVFKKPNDISISKVGHSGIHGKTNLERYSQMGASETFSKIPNVGCPTITDTYITTKPIDKFLSKDDLENLRSINEFGEESDIKNTDISSILTKLEVIASKNKSVPCNIEWNSHPNSWFFVNFFPTKHFINGSHKKNGKHVMPSIGTTELVIPNEPFIRIFSNSKNGCKIRKLAKKFKFKTQDFNTNKRFKFGIKVGRKSTFGENGDINYLKTL